jgi:hypothetical protein
MPTSQDIIKSVATHLHENLLKTSGFKKSGMTWNRGSPWVQVLNIQSDRNNTSASGHFTINLGIFVPEIQDVTEGPPVKGAPKEYDCGICSRIGEILPSMQDFWWSTEMPWEQLATQVLETTALFAIPWFDRVGSSMSSIADEFRRREEWLDASVAYALAGDKASANECIAHKLAYMNPAAVPKVRRVAERCGIEIPPQQISQMF